MGAATSSTNKARTLIIGLDGATFDLIIPWAQSGHLSTLRKLMAEGAHGPLKAWPNMNSASAWTSMVTGCNPGQHGVYDFVDFLSRQGQDWHPTTARDRRRDPFWRILHAAGQRVGIANVPISYPADPVDGFMLSGMDAPSMDSPGFAHPADLLDELRRRGIDYILDVPYLGIASQRAPRQLPDAVQHMVDARARTVLHLMQAHCWDLLMAVFVAPDRVQHFFWPGRGVPLDDPAWAPILSLYRQIDSFLAEALSLLDGNTHLLLVSDHGFGSSMPAKLHLNELLARLGLLCFAQSPQRPSDSLLKGLLVYGRRLLPQSAQDALAGLFPWLHNRAVNALTYRELDWSQTQVFASPQGGTLHINLQGRQPHGIVSAGDYAPLRERVRQILLDLVDPASGRHLVRSVHSREELYHGPCLAGAPDLVVNWEYDLLEDALGYRQGSEMIVVEGPAAQATAVPWSGTHRPDGILIAWGPDIQPGAAVAGANLYDIAATLLYLQGRPIPSDLDGRVLVDIFSAERLHRAPVETSEPIAGTGGTATAALDPKDLLRIEERLRGLGYIE